MNTKDSGFNKYMYKYLQVLKDIDYSKYDANFIDIYKEGKYVIDDSIYDVSEIYLIITDNMKRYIIKAGINVDIITGEELQGKKAKIICLRDTSMFYKLYKDGIITNKEMSIDKNTLKKYIDAWDLEKQYMIPELEADRVVTKYLKENNN